MHLMDNSLLIRPAAPEDSQLLCSWWNDGQVMAHAGYPNGLGISEGEVRAALLRNQEQHRRFILEIAGVPAGEMNYRLLSPGTAEIGIKICLPHQQNQGYGTASLRMFIRYLIEELEVHTITLDTNLKNSRAQHVYQKLGFRQCAVHYDSCRNQTGELQSFIVYELSASDYLQHQQGGLGHN